MEKKLFYCFFLIMAGFSCRNEETQQADLSLKLLWQLPMHEQEDIYKMVDINDNIFYDNGIVVGNYENGKRGLRMIDIATQKTRWTWTEDIHPGFDIDLQYQYENYLVVTKLEKVYCIDLNNGATKFIKTLDFDCDNWVAGIGTTFFFSNYEVKGESSLYKGNILTGEIVKYLTPDYEREVPLSTPLAIPRLMYKATATVYQGDTLLNVLYVEPMAPPDMFPKMGIYNMSKRQWLYQNLKVVEPSTGYNTMPNGARIIEDKIYLASGHDLACFELLTGKEIWRRNEFYHEFPFAFSGYEIYDGVLVSNTEEGKTYGIDIKTGNNIWKIDKAGAPWGYMKEYKGILYYFAGGFFRCVDLHTGKILLSTTLKTQGFTQSRVVIAPPTDGGKAKILITTSKALFVFEALN